MFVQDIQSPGVNITAELTEKEVDSFKALCKMFISTNLHGQTIDKFFSELAQMQSTSSASNMNYKGRSAHELPLCSKQKLSANKQQICRETEPVSDRGDDVVSHENTANVGAPSVSPSVTENVMNIDKVLMLARIGMDEIQALSKGRIDSDQAGSTNSHFCLLPLIQK